MPDVSRRGAALEPAAIRAADVAAPFDAPIDLVEGDPWMATAPDIVEAAVDGLRAGATHYVEAAGLPELRAAILAADPRLAALGLDDVLVTAGAKLALFALCMCLLDPEDGAIILDPASASYDPMVRLAGGRPLRAASRAEDRFFPDLADLEPLGRRAKLLLLNSPNDPTGRVYDHTELSQLLAFAARHDLWVVSDEIYNRTRFVEQCPSVLDFPEHAERIVLVNGFSKSFAMAGWRVGYLAAPRAVAGAALRILRRSQACVAPFVQKAAAQALTPAGLRSVERLMDDVRRRRYLVAEILSGAPGLRLHPIEGGFFAWVGVAEIERDAGRFAAALRAKGVSVTPGEAFGASGEGHIRLSFVRAPFDDLADALRRIVGLAACYRGA